MGATGKSGGNAKTVIAGGRTYVIDMAGTVARIAADKRYGLVIMISHPDILPVQRSGIL